MRKYLCENFPTILVDEKNKYPKLVKATTRQPPLLRVEGEAVHRRVRRCKTMGNDAPVAHLSALLIPFDEAEEWEVKRNTNSNRMMCILM